MFRQLTLVALALAVALLAFGAGAAWIVQDWRTPDSVQSVQRLRAAQIDGSEALTARTLAEAERARAEAEAIASATFYQNAQQALGLLACSGLLAGLFVGAVYLGSRRPEFD